MSNATNAAFTPGPPLVLRAPSPLPLLSRRRPRSCSPTNPRAAFPPAPSRVSTTVSHAAHSVALHSDSVSVHHLRRRRLHLLVADVCLRVHTELPSDSCTSLNPALSNLSTLATALAQTATTNSTPNSSSNSNSNSNSNNSSYDVSTTHGNGEGAPIATQKEQHQQDRKNDGELRALLRSALWDLRSALRPFTPSDHLRAALERARSALLHTGAMPTWSTATEYALLSAEVSLLDELLTLRSCERALHACTHTLSPSVRQAVWTAAMRLFVDEHRVRGKSALTHATIELRDVAKNLEVWEAVYRANELLDVLTACEVEDARRRRRPAGKAMLIRPRVTDIPNFARVTERMLRGGQPSSGGLDWLIDYGVTDVVDLRGSDAGNSWAADRRRAAAAKGIRFWNVAIEDFGTPKMEQLLGFLELVQEVLNRNGVLFVHCKAGIGRTGTMVACWRVVGGMDVDEALGNEKLYTEGGGGLKQERFVRMLADAVRDGSLGDWEVERPMAIELGNGNGVADE